MLHGIIWLLYILCFRVCGASTWALSVSLFLCDVVFVVWMLQLCELPRGRCALPINISNTQHNEIASLQQTRRQLWFFFFYWSFVIFIFFRVNKLLYSAANSCFLPVLSQSLNITVMMFFQNLMNTWENMKRLNKEQLTGWLNLLWFVLWVLYISVNVRSGATKPWTEHIMSKVPLLPTDESPSTFSLLCYIFAVAACINKHYRPLITNDDEAAGQRRQRAFMCCVGATWILRWQEAGGCL